LQVQISAIRVFAGAFDVLHKQSSDFLRHTQLLEFRPRPGPQSDAGFGWFSSNYPSVEIT
jgi:hypothetical protein